MRPSNSMTNKGSRNRNAGLAFVIGCVAIGTALALASSESSGIVPSLNGDAVEAALEPPEPIGTKEAADFDISELDYEAEPFGLEPASNSPESQFEECISKVSRVESEPCLLAEIDRLDDAIPPAIFEAIKQQCELEAASELNASVFTLECILFEISHQSEP